MAAMHYLTHAKRCRIQGIYYGMFDSNSGEAPVISLDGLLRIQELSEALSGSRVQGTLTPLSRALDDDELPGLDQATFLLDTMQLGRSKKACGAVLQELRKTDRPLLRIARDELEGALTQGMEASAHYHLRQQRRGLRALNAGDYSTCATMFFEALITAALRASNPTGDSHNHDDRSKARGWLHDRFKSQRHDDFDAYMTLSGVRNALAHGSRARGQAAQRVLHDRVALEAFLNQTNTWLDAVFARLDA